MVLLRVIAILLLSGLLYGQTSLPEDEVIAVQAGDYFSRLQELSENPLDMNKASARQLRDIPFLNRKLISAILNYRRKTGEFQTVDELLRINGVSGELLEAMRAYLQVEAKPRALRLVYDQRLAATAHKTRAYVRDLYGSRLAIRQRFLLQMEDRFKFILQTEKDAGEPNWRDHVSGSAAIELRRLHSHVVLGDYYAWFAQGLISGGAYGKRLTAGSGHSALIPGMLRVRQKTGADEFAFLRGISWQVQPIEPLQLTTLVSVRKLDAVLSEDSLTVLRLVNTGFHRSESELARRNSQREKRLALAATLNLKAFSIGALYQINQYFKKQQFTGLTSEGGWSGSIAFSYRTESWKQSVELARGIRGRALMASVVTQSMGMRFGAGVFYYSPLFISPHGRRFGAFGQSPANRFGVQLLQNLILPAALRVSIHLEAGRPVQPEVAFPITSWAASAYAEQRFKRIVWKLRYSQRSSGNEELQRDRLPVRRRLRLDLEYQPNKRLRLSQRIDFSRALGKSYGIALQNDLRYRVTSFGNIQFRYTHFDVPDFDLRLYELETGLPGELETRLLNGFGYKWFALATVSPVDYLQVGLKYRVEYYPDEQTLGSGNDLIDGNARRFLRGYLRLKW
ncbi:MAG: ComEA family DNA-binding protein [Calditrichia bacterium]